MRLPKTRPTTALLITGATTTTPTSDPPRPPISGAGLTAVASFAASVSYTHLRAHETRHDLVCRLLLEKKNTEQDQPAVAVQQQQQQQQEQQQQQQQQEAVEAEAAEDAKSTLYERTSTYTAVRDLFRLNFGDEKTAPTVVPPAFDIAIT